jgi:WD40 repeat protein
MFLIEAGAILHKNNRYVIKVASVFLIFCTFVLPSQVLAFKVDTHVCVAESKRAEVEAGKAEEQRLFAEDKLLKADEVTKKAEKELWRNYIDLGLGFAEKMKEAKNLYRFNDKLLFETHSRRLLKNLNKNIVDPYLNFNTLNKVMPLKYLIPHVWNGEPGSFQPNWGGKILGDDSPDDKLFAGIISLQGTLRVWDVKNGNIAFQTDIIDRSRSSEDRVLDIAFSFDSKKIFIVLRENHTRTKLIIIDAINGEVIREFIDISDFDVFENTNKFLVSQDSTIYVINANTFKVDYKVEVDSGLVKAIEISPNGNLIASIISNSKLVIFSTKSGGVLVEKEGIETEKIQFSPDNNKLFIYPYEWSGDDTIILDVSNGDEITSFSHSASPVFFFSSARFAYVGNNGHDLVIGDTGTGESLDRINVGPNVISIRLLNDENKIVTVHSDSYEIESSNNAWRWYGGDKIGGHFANIRIWSLDNRQKLFESNFDYQIFDSITTIKGKNLITYSELGFHQWKIPLFIENKSYLRKYEVLGPQWGSILLQDYESWISPGGKYLAIGLLNAGSEYVGLEIFKNSSDYTWINNNEGEKFYQSLEWEGSLDIEFSPDDEFVVFRLNGKSYRILNLNSGEKIDIFGKYDDFIIHPKGFSLLEFSPKGNGRLISVRDGQVLSPKVFGLEFYNPTFSPDGSMIAVSNSIGTINIWAFDDEVLLHRFKGHKSKVKKMAFSPDNKILVTSAEGEEYIFIWDLLTGELISKFNIHTDRVKDIIFHPVKNLLSVGVYGAIYIWKLPFNNNPILINSGSVKGITFNSNSMLLTQLSYGGTLLIRDIKGVLDIYKLFKDMDIEKTGKLLGLRLEGFTPVTIKP